MVVASPFPANHGTPGSIREMTQEMARQGYEIHVVTYHFGESTLPEGVHVHRIPNLGFRDTIVVGPTVEKPLLDFLLAVVLCRVIRRERIDIIHAHNYEGALVGYVGKLLTGRPLIYNAINTMADELPSYGFVRPRFLASWLARFLDHWVPRLPDRTIAISDELGTFLRDRGVPADQLHVIPLGVDASRFERVDRDGTRKRLGVECAPVVMYTGILDAMQRLDYLLEAMAVVVRALPTARLIIVANTLRDEQRQDFDQQVAAQGLQSHVKIVRNVAFDEVPEFLGAADVTVVPRPHCPGFPVKMLNYMAAGKAVVVFAGSAKGLEHLKNAYVVADHDAKAMGEGILLLLRDPDLRDRLGRDARQRVQESYALDRLVERTVAVYRELLPSPDVRSAAEA